MNCKVWYLKESLRIKLVLFSTLIIVVSCCSCNNNPSNQSKVESKPKFDNNFTKTFEGSINNNYDVSMTLVKSANALNGTYNYKGKNTAMKLVGNIDNNGNITLNEFNDKGNITGNFKGQLNGKNFNGIWSKPDGNNSMPFSLVEKYSNDYQSNSPSNNKSNSNSDLTYENSQSDNTISNAEQVIWEGLYKDQFGRTLKISNVKSDAFNFTITPRYTEDCYEGEMTGLGIIADYNTNVANFYDVNGEFSDEEQCQLDFILIDGNDEIEIVDRNCMHGQPCGDYNSTFKRK